MTTDGARDTDPIGIAASSLIEAGRPRLQTIITLGVFGLKNGVLGKS